MRWCGGVFLLTCALMACHSAHADDTDEFASFGTDAPDAGSATSGAQGGASSAASARTAQARGQGSGEDSRGHLHGVGVARNGASEVSEGRARGAGSGTQPAGSASRGGDAGSAGGSRTSGAAGGGSGSGTEGDGASPGHVKGIDGDGAESPTAGAHAQAGGLVPAWGFLPEYAALLFAALYVVCYLQGRKHNEQLARAWLAEFGLFFQEQFADCHVNDRHQIAPLPVSSAGATGAPGPASGACEAAGAPDEGNVAAVGNDAAEAGDGEASPPSLPPTLMKESSACYRFYASGRRYCQFLMADLQMHARQDLFSQVWAALRPPRGGVMDVCTIDIGMNAEDMDPFIFAACRADLVKTFFAEQQDVRALASQVTDKSYLALLPPRFALFSDSREIIPQLINNKIEKVLKQASGGLLLSVHFTDRNRDLWTLGRTVRPCAHNLRFRFRMPPAEQIGELRTLIQMAVYFADVVGREAKLSKVARKKAESVRADLERRQLRSQHEARQEAMQRRKMDKAQREKEEYETLTKEQKLRRDIRDEKKKEKLRQKKMFRMKVRRA